MNKLLVCFVGVGSIAVRHIENLRTICLEYNIELEIDAIRRNGKRDAKDIAHNIGNVYGKTNELSKVYDIIFITNPTEYHIETLEQITRYGKNFFIEKPISTFAQLDRVESYNTKENSTYYIASPLRYNSVIRYIKENIPLEDILSIRSISSSYLPEWRKKQDYRETYSASRKLGGGVSIDLIHEWDYLTFLFGYPKDIKCMMGKKSDLEIDTEDYAIYIADYGDKIVEVHLDYFGRENIREITLFTKYDTIRGNLIDNTLAFLKEGKIINFNEERNDCQLRELRYFINLIKNDIPTNDNIKQAINLLRLTQGII